MKWVVPVVLVLVGLLHLLPLGGVASREALLRLYGVAVDDPSLELLLRHRAVLFGLLGGFMVAAAFRPAWQPAALVAGTISVLSFLLLAWLIGGRAPAFTAPVLRVVWLDAAALVLLVVAAVAVTMQMRPTPPG